MEYPHARQWQLDDATVQVSGSWVLKLPPSQQSGLLIYVMVDSVAATIELAGSRSGRKLDRPLPGAILKTEKMSAEALKAK
jgi:hypothetical protein